jgi:hypothetical protein
MSEISKDKQYTTRDGREVRIYATDGAGEYSVHGALKSSEGWFYTTWGSQGHIMKPCTETVADLIEVKPRMKIDQWLFVYRDGSTAWTNVKPNPDGKNVFAVKHIVLEVEEGEGLS